MYIDILGLFERMSLTEFDCPDTGPGTDIKDALCRLSSRGEAMAAVKGQDEMMVLDI